MLFDFSHSGETSVPGAMRAVAAKIANRKRRVKQNVRKIEMDNTEEIVPPDGMTLDDDYFKTFDGLRLYYTRLVPSGKVEGTLVIIPGKGAPIREYRNFAHAFARQGYQVFALDLRSQGQSEGEVADPRVIHVNNVNEYLRDIGEFILKIVKPQQTGSLVLAGHSMGAALLVLTLVKNRASMPRCHFLPIAPMIEVQQLPRGRKVKAIRLGMKAAKIARNGKRKVGPMRADGTFLSVAWVDTLFDIGKRLQKVSPQNIAEHISLFLLGNDGVVSNPAAEKFFSNSGKDTKHKIHLLPEVAHDLNRGDVTVTERIADLALHDIRSSLISPRL